MAKLTNDERMDILLSLIDRMEDSVRDLTEIDHAEDAECIKDILRQLNDEVTELNARMFRRQQVEFQAMERQYYRSVM